MHIRNIHTCQKYMHIRNIYACQIYICVKNICMSKSRCSCSFQTSCFQKFRNIHSKTPVLESLFNKVATLLLVTLLKKYSSTGVFLLILKTIKNTYFTEHLQATVSVI